MQLIKLEWLKIKKYRTFYILSGLFLAIYTLINIAVNRGAFNIHTSNGKGQSLNLISSDYSFPKVWDNMAYYFGWCIIFICVFIIINITNDYRYKTQRQHVIDGQSRLDYLHSKVALVLGISIALTLVYIVMCVLFGMVNGAGSFSIGFKNILYVFLYAINYIGFSALIAIFIKRSGLSIMLFLTFVIVEEIVVAILKNFAQLDIGKYFPLDSSDGLLPKPLDGMAKLVTDNALSKTDFTTMAVMSAVWVLIYYFIARFRLQRTDL